MCWTIRKSSQGGKTEMTSLTIERNNQDRGALLNEPPVDAELAQARTALLRSNIYVLRKLQVDRDGDRLVLRGRVESYYHKQLAQELVRADVHGSEVLNALQVVYAHKADFVG
jgi:hypothetical protein